MTPEKSKQQIADEPDIDPYVLLRRQHKALVEKVAMLEKQVSNLQITWDRLLNVSQEPPLSQQTPHPVQPQPPEPTEPTRAYSPWEQIADKADEVKKEEPKRGGKITTLILFVGLAIILALGFLWSRGWSCALLGGG